MRRCSWCGVVDGCGGKRAKVVVVWLWSFGNDVSGGDLVVLGGRGDHGCGDGGMGGVVVKGCDVVCGDSVVEVWLVQNNDSNRKTYLKGSQPGEHEDLPLNNGGEIYLNMNLAA